MIMEYPKKGDSVTQWHFFYETRKTDPGGGLILKNISHDKYAFAKDIRVTGIWVCSDSSPLSHLNDGKLKHLILGSDNLPVSADQKDPIVQVPISIYGYPPFVQVSQQFRTASDVLAEKSGRLTVEQRYMFTKYSNTPRHEPSGALMAARFHPELAFEFSKPEDPKEAPRYIRVDYRLEIALDTLVQNLALITRSPKQFSKFTEAKQSCGVFVDREDWIKTIAGLSTIFELRWGSEGRDLAVTDAIFKRAEKPLKYEIIGDGIKKGQPGKWDNIHYWSYRHPPQPLPSTPGAFHAAHLHWRWGESATAQGGPHFTREEIGKKGLSLIDPKNTEQNLRFAIVDRTRFPKESEWGTPFQFLENLSKGEAPADADVGGLDLVTWISVEVYRDLGKFPLGGEWKGTLFLHGLFFAHQPEMRSKYTGTTKKFYKEPENPERKWER